MLVAVKALSLLRTRFLTTALPMDLGVINAKRPVPGTKCSVKNSVLMRFPERIAVLISDEDLSRLALGSKAGPRRLVLCDPYGGGRPGWRDLHGCACVHGNRGSWRDDGYSAEMCACSL